MRVHSRSFFSSIGVSLLCVLGASQAAETRLRSESSGEAIRVYHGDALKFAYVRKQPEGLKLPSAGYFHPLTTPSGTVVTDVGPDDHPHHRGVFLAWLQVSSENGLSGDYWGWGKDAPVEWSEIVPGNHSSVSSSISNGQSKIQFHLDNQWRAGGKVLLQEDLKGHVSSDRDQGAIHDLTYRLTAPQGAVLGRQVFSGFCVRLRKDGVITPYSREGKVTLPPPSHLKHESNWPDQGWYALSIQLGNGEKVGVAVLNHPENPKTVWHVVPGIAMINPCIVSTQEVKIPKEEPLTLRYRVVTFDGEVPVAWLNEQSEEFAKTASDPKS